MFTLLPLHNHGPNRHSLVLIFILTEFVLRRENVFGSETPFGDTGGRTEEY